MCRGNSCLVLPGVLVLALAAAAPQAQAQITVVDNASLNQSSSSTGTVLSMSFTATGGDMLVVEVADKNNASSGGDPTTITWNNVTLHQVVEETSVQNAYRDVVIYDAPINSANYGSGIIRASTGNFLEESMTAFTLSGVNTAVSAGTAAFDSQGATTTSTTAALNVVPGSSRRSAMPFRLLAETKASGPIPAARPARPAEHPSFFRGPIPVALLSSVWAIFPTLPPAILSLPAQHLRVMGSGKSPLAIAVFTPLINYSWSGERRAGVEHQRCQLDSARGTVYTRQFERDLFRFGQQSRITIASSGVQPASVTFTNNSLAYSFSGGAIAGPATVTLNGLGQRDVEQLQYLYRRHDHQRRNACKSATAAVGPPSAARAMWATTGPWSSTIATPLPLRRSSAATAASRKTAPAVDPDRQQHVHWPNHRNRRHALVNGWLSASSSISVAGGDSLGGRAVLGPPSSRPAASS